MDARDSDEFLAPREIARERRRDRDISAPERSGMRTGPAKRYKQLADLHAKRADPAYKPPKRTGKRKKNLR